MSDSEIPRSLVPALDPEVESVVCLGVVYARPVRIASAGTALEEEMAELATSLKVEHAGRAPGEIAGLADARTLYKTFGIDPTRTRPSSEALLRRVLKDKPLPRILNAVDLCTLCSLRFLLPLGLYDAGKLRPPIGHRRGRAGETYPGIRKNEVHLAGRPVLVDREGPFGNPTSDSLRASVTRETTALLMVIFAPAACSPDRMRSHVEFARRQMERHLASPTEPVVTGATILP